MNSIVEKTQKILAECQEKNAKLCVAAKTQSSENLALANISPEIIFAENRVQEAESKQEFYASIPNELHLIGPLQSNKVKKAVQMFDVIQTVDSLKLLRRIDKISGEEGKMVRVFLNINITADPKKSGLLVEDLVLLMKDLKKNPHQNIIISGLFTILQNGLSSSEISGFYGLIRKIFESLKAHFGIQFTEISMGMSGDYSLALEQGATRVRVGSGIFGKREKSH